MGLTVEADPKLVAPAKPLVAPNDPYFLEINNELADKGFLVVDASSTIDCRPGERFQIFLEEMRFRGADGILRRVPLLVELAAGYQKMGDVLGWPNTPNLGDVPGALKAYAKAGRVKTETARLLGIKTSALYYKLEKYKIV